MVNIPTNPEIKGHYNRAFYEKVYARQRKFEDQKNELSKAEKQKRDDALIAEWLSKNEVCKLDKHGFNLNSKTVSKRQANAFYKTVEWKTLSAELRKTAGPVCIMCNRDFKKYGLAKNADHINPLMYFWDLRLDPENIQIICGECNKAKGSYNLESLESIKAIQSK
jgi:5-methylcytosine-specific restriction endonuclease McrA